MRYDAVISLGGNCEVAEHWRRFSGRHTAFPFDWWITPFESVGLLLKEKFENLFALENMTLTNDGRTVMCRRYGIAHHHDFPRIEGSAAQIDVGLIADACERGRRKLGALSHRFYAACAPGQKILFIRSWRGTLDFPAQPQAGDDVVHHDFAMFIRTLSDCLPGVDFRVLFVNYGPQRIDHPRALFHNIEDKGDRAGWSGSPGGWDEMFRTHIVRDEAPARIEHHAMM